MVPKLKEILATKGYSLTKPRLTVFSALQGSKPKTMKQLVESLNGIIDRASIYRTISLFEKLAVINKIQSGWKYKLELSDDFMPHHHHLTCTNCTRVVSFDEPSNFDKFIENLAHQYDFVAKNHNLEIYGLCRECQSKLA